MCSGQAFISSRQSSFWGVKSSPQILLRGGGGVRTPSLALRVSSICVSNIVGGKEEKEFCTIYSQDAHEEVRLQRRELEEVNAIAFAWKTQAQGHSQKVLGVLAQGHVHDAQRVVGMLLCRQQEGEQVQRVNIIALKLKSLTDIPQSLRYLV